MSALPRTLTAFMALMDEDGDIPLGVIDAVLRENERLRTELVTQATALYGRIDELKQAIDTLERLQLGTEALPDPDQRKAI